jgi:hypothetical protein
LNNYTKDCLLNANECSIPKKDIFNNKKLLPSYILDLIKIRKIYRKKYQKERLTEFRSKYNNLTKIIRTEIDIYKNIEWTQFFKNKVQTPLTPNHFGKTK